MKDLFRDKSALWSAAPYILWMAMMFTMEKSAFAYSLQTLVAGAVLVAGLFYLIRKRVLCLSVDCRTIGWGIFAGVAVFILWVAMELVPWFSWRIWGEGIYRAAEKAAGDFAPEHCGWSLTALKAFGSALVIAPAEELFFRFFLYRRLQSAAWSEVPERRFDSTAFVWMTVLFALEHDPRFLAGAMAGAVYGAVTMTRGIGAAIVAHVVTNGLLGAYVIHTGQWGFW